ncbi:MAG TPA: hypothetical protein VKU02_11025, partial [Gemmataceae bacterium]|nr:hypothetical protein [Gemmataceae bacterium]
IATLLWGALNQPVQARHGVGNAQSGWEFLGSSFLLRYLPKDVFLVLWPVYGFSVGQLLGLVARKNAVALVLSLLVSVPAIGIWIPSLVVGGLKLWQVLPFAAALLLATRVGIWAWAGNLLKNWSSAAGMIGCVGLGGLWLAGNLVYRAVEIPDVGEPLEVIRSAVSLPSMEQIDAGVRTRRAVREFASLEQAAQERLDRIDQAATPELAEGLAGAAAPGAAVVERPTPYDAITQILEHGWPDTDAELASWWLEQICRGEWIRDLHEAAAVPWGVVEDPRQVASIPASTCQRLAQVLAARALQVQARGDSPAALDHLLWVLAFSRSLRHHTVAAYYQEGMAVETTALQGLDRWLERLATTASGEEPPVQASAFAARSKLLERALVQLNRHEEEMPPPTDPVVAEYPFLAQLMEDPVRWYYTVTGSSTTADVERDLIGLSFQTPWEKERARRFLHALTCSRLKEAQTPYWQLPLQARVGPRIGLPLADAAISSCFIPDTKQRPFRPGQWEHLLADSGLLLRLFALSSRPDHLKQAFSLCRVRAARLKLALSLFEIHEQRPAPSLAHLVPRYLEDVPQDPFSGAAFHYLVSKGQRIDWQQTPGLKGPGWTELAPGQSILWTVGPEAIDISGGMHPSFRKRPSPQSQFMDPEHVFLVPSWPR